MPLDKLTKRRRIALPGLLDKLPLASFLRFTFWRGFFGLLRGFNNTLGWFCYQVSQLKCVCGIHVLSPFEHAMKGTPESKYNLERFL